MIFYLIFQAVSKNYTYPSGINEIFLTAGQYTVECYGAQGGESYYNGEHGANGGKGAYVKGVMNITGTGTKFYGYVGGKGKNSTKGGMPGGFNGGGKSGIDVKASFIDDEDDGSGSGGGATDLRIFNKLLSNRIIVAAGGSGAAGKCEGAPGGEIYGYYPNANNIFLIAYDVSQKSGTKNGVGGNGVNSSNFPGSGGGGGWRGGFSSNDYSNLESSNWKAVAESGSSYISGYEGCPKNAKMTFKSGQMKAGQNSGDGKLVIIVDFNCSFKCLSCTDKETCTSCADGYNLKNNKCYSSCGTGYYSSNKKCIQCNSACKACSKTSTNCTSCNEGFYLHNNKCIEKCPNGFYGSNKKCVECKDPCQRCNNTADECLSCVDGYVLYNNKCWSTCPDGTYKTEHTCELCHSYCSTCYSTATNCTSCNENYSLYENQCLLSCPDNTVSFENHCVPCKLPCATCDKEYNSCISCIENYYLYENKCYPVCPKGTIHSGNICVKKTI